MRLSRSWLGWVCYIVIVSFVVSIASPRLLENSDDISDAPNATFYSASGMKMDSTKSRQFSRQMQASNNPNIRPTFGIVGRVESLFFCSLCSKDLETEERHLLEAIHREYPEAILVSRNSRLLNAYFIQFSSRMAEESDTIVSFLAGLPGDLVTHVFRSTPLPLAQANRANTVEVASYVGALDARTEYCLTGKGIRVAIVDTGIDYTHELFGGPGTRETYALAYGESADSELHTTRDGLFPTERVVDGYDFVGEVSLDELQPDEDPIDVFNGHGTYVASSLLSTAPDVDIVALKACFDVGCGEGPILNAMEYALDPNGDGDTADRVHVLNLSIGSRFVDPYYSATAHVVERAAALGVLVVTAAGNNNNIPYVMGEESKTPNSFSVGATWSPGTNQEGVMAEFSSRGPGGNAKAFMKPDLVAPGGFTSGLARAGTGRRYGTAAGTSFSAPVVAGVAALLMERCPDCSPLAVKALLQNNAQRTTRYQMDSEELAPLSWGGAGQLDTMKALQADLWAYSLEDALPSINLGMLDVTRDETIRRTIRVTKMASDPQFLEVRIQFRDADDESLGALDIELVDSPPIELEGPCGSFADITIDFRIIAENVPTNRMTGLGRAAQDPTRLDQQEFDGWIVIENTVIGRDISVPFYTILRQAADVSVGNTGLPALVSSPTILKIDLVNNGVGTAQMDAFELLVLSSDTEEGPFGVGRIPADIRYIGYRSIPVERDECAHLLEFAFVLWERNTIAASVEHHVNIFNTSDSVSYVLADAVMNSGTLVDECLVHDVEEDETRCSGFKADHSTNGVNTVLRVCSNDVGITEEGSYQVGFLTRSVGVSRDVVPYNISIRVPGDVIIAGNYDVLGGRRLFSVPITGSFTTPSGTSPLGLLFLTDAYRSPTRTGAVAPGSEAFVVIRDGVEDPPERTADVLEFPTLVDMQGPDCRWTDDTESCPNLEQTRRYSMEIVDSEAILPNMVNRRTQVGNCPEREIPRLDTATLAPSVTPTSAPTAPTEAPSFEPSAVSAPSWVSSSQTSSYPTPFPTTGSFESLSSATRANLYWIEWLCFLVAAGMTVSFFVDSFDFFVL